MRSEEDTRAGWNADTAGHDEMGTRTPADWPSISDYWPDAPHRIGPEADVYLDDEAADRAGTVRVTAAGDDPPPRATEHATEAEPVAARRQNSRVLAGIAVSALLVAGLIAVIVVRMPVAQDLPAGTAPSAPALEQQPEQRPDEQEPQTPPSPAVASAPLAGAEEASFAVLSDVTTLRITVEDLDGLLFRATAPDTSSVLPNAVTADGEVRLFLPDSGVKGRSEVDIVLHSSVRWNLRLVGGVDQGTVDLSTARVGEVDLVGGSTSIALSLPTPEGTLPVTMSGGASVLRIDAPGGVPVRAVLRQGAGKVVFGSRTDEGVARGRTFQSSGWDEATDRIDVDATAGAGTLRIG